MIFPLFVPNNILFIPKAIDIQHKDKLEFLNLSSLLSLQYCESEGFAIF